MKYNIQDYHNLLITLLDHNYMFISYDSWLSSKNSNVCLLRHDIDVNLNAAYKLAKIEEYYGISSTYFIMLRSPIYNAFSRINCKYIEKIVRHNHFIGLHYDAGFNEQQNHDEMRIIEEIQTQITFIEKNWGVKVSVVSFHQPSSLILENKLNLSSIINTYDKRLKEKFYYLSDSNMKLDFNNMFKKINEGTNIQLLIHPMWWYFEGTCTYDKWKMAILDNFDQAEKQLIKTERAYKSMRLF